MSIKRLRGLMQGGSTAAKAMHRENHPTAQKEADQEYYGAVHDVKERLGGLLLYNGFDFRVRVRREIFCAHGREFFS